MASGTEAGRSQLGLLWAGVALALLALSPLLPTLARAAPRCPLKTLTGVPCATCGSTRAAVALSRLDVATALRMNPAVTIGILGLVLGGLAAGALALAGRSIPEPRAFPVWARIGILAAFVANWVWVIADGR